MIDQIKKPALKAGDYGYINARKKLQLTKVILWVVLIAAIIAGGWLRFGSRFNVVTVLGILFVLPAAKTLVSFIVIAPYKTGDAHEYEQIHALAGEQCICLADLVLTRYEGSMNIEIALIAGGNVFAYVPKQKTPEAKIKEYLALCVKNSKSEAVPSVYTDFSRFYEIAKKAAAGNSKPTKKDEAIRKEILSRAV